MKEPSFTVGIEEEYLLVDAETRGLIHEAPPTMLAECEALLEGQVAPEFLQCQIEVGTRVCATVGEARADLERLRSTVASVARSHGLRLVAASTHPFAVWGEQMRTQKERYQTIEHDLQEVVRRLVICGMHVHVGIDDDELRIDLMNQVSYVLPHLLALGTSSPFWQGQPHRAQVLPDLGMGRDAAHRAPAAVRELRRVSALSRGARPRRNDRGRDEDLVGHTPERAVPHPGDADQRHLHPARGHRVHRRALRVLAADALPAAREEPALAALPAALIAENRWRAQRYGIDQGLVDFGRGVVVDYPELLEEMIELCAEDAEALDCTAEIEHARRIVERGTSAHWQVRTWRDAIADGASEHEALEAVVDMLVEETMHGIE